MSTLDRGARAALSTLVLLAVITAGWWALALWPAPGETPAWLERARLVCFGATGSGLPDASGWMLLVGQPLGMLGLLLAGWREALARGMSALAATWRGRFALGTGGTLVLAGLVGAGARVAEAQGPDEGLFFTHELPPPTYPRLDRPAPEDVLVDQHGEAVGMADLRGRPVIVTFGYAHCATVCPAVVAQALRAREILAGELDLEVVVITLDPWRDTPARLPHLARQWGLEGVGHVLGGSVEQVEAALDGWSVARRRDPRTGEITHPALVFLVDAGGRIAYASNGSPEAIAELARRM